MSVYLRLIFFYLITSANIAANAQSYSLTTYTGGSLGVVQYEEKDTRISRRQIFGGNPVGFALSLSETRKTSWQVGGDLLVDLLNNQISRTGFFLQYAYHFWGGVPLSRRENSLYTVEEKNPWFSGFVSRIYHFNYNLVGQKNPDLVIKGSVVDVKIGLQFSSNLTSYFALGGMGLVSVAIFPVSDDRIFPGTTELLLFCTLTTPH